eukprot:jgi/Bigna1/84505/fgenesh1_pg.143_\
MGVRVSVVNDTESPVSGQDSILVSPSCMKMLGGAKVLGWGFELSPKGQQGDRFEKKDGGLLKGAPYICRIKIDLDGDGMEDKVEFRFTATSQVTLLVSEMLKSGENTRLTGGEITLVETVNCSLRRKGFSYHTGKLYIHTDRLLFDANFSRKRDFEFSLSQIHAVAKRTNLKIPNAIKISVKMSNGSHKEYYFTGFSDRDRVFDTIARVMSGGQHKEFTELDSSEIILRYYQCSFERQEGGEAAAAGEGEKSPKCAGTMYLSPNFVCFYCTALTDKIKGTDIVNIKPSGKNQIRITAPD